MHGKMRNEMKRTVQNSEVSPGRLEGFASSH